MQTLKLLTVDFLAPLGALLLFWMPTALFLDNVHVVPGPWHVFTHSLPSFALMGPNAGPSAREAMQVIGRNVVFTATLAAAGWIFGTIFGVTIGFAVGGIGSRARGIAPYRSVAAIKNLPLFAFIPLFQCWFSSRQITIIAYVAFATAVIVLPGASAAAALTPQNELDLARSAGASRFTMIFRVILPSAWPRLLPTIRWAFLLVWAFSLGAEYAGSAREGIGVLAYQSYLWADVGRMYVIGVVYLLLAGITVTVFDTVVFRHSSENPFRRLAFKE